MNIIQFENGVKYFQSADYGKLYRFNREHEIQINTTQGVLAFTEDIQTVEIHTSESKLSHYDRDGEIVSIQEYNDLKQICDSNAGNIDNQIRWMRFSHNIKPIYEKVECWISKGFNVNKIPYSEYPEIEPLFTYSGDVSKPTYAILKHDELLKLAKNILLDRGFKPISPYAYDEKNTRYTFAIDTSFEYAKINGTYIDKYGLKSYGGNFTGEYTQCVNRLREFKNIIQKIIHDVDLKESKRVLSLGEAAKYYNDLSNLKKELYDFQGSKAPRAKLEPIIKKISEMVLNLDEYITKNEEPELESDKADEF